MLQAVTAFTRRGERFVEHPQQIWALNLMTLYMPKEFAHWTLAKAQKKKPDQIIRIQQTVSLKASTQDHFIFSYLCHFFDS